MWTKVADTTVTIGVAYHSTTEKKNNNRKTNTAVSLSYHGLMRGSVDNFAQTSSHSKYMISFFVANHFQV